MSYKKLLPKIGSKTKPLKTTVKPIAKTIHERDTFHELIKLERDRVHRNDRQFSLLLIRINKKDNAKAPIFKIVQNVSKRVRKIDQLGWYDDNHLGVLLPNTPHTGALVFANDVRKCQNDCDEIPIVLKTLSYPINS
ncbi:MAG: hypothetical protein PVJ84_10725 [Desulfobacteraceae bacterium]|jgi:PleD family two-component response regulator